MKMNKKLEKNENLGLRLKFINKNKKYINKKLKKIAQKNPMEKLLGKKLEKKTPFL